MAENRPSETIEDRRITWGLMAAVMLFVILMTAIVLWITTSLIRNEIGGAGEAGVTRTATPEETRATAAPSATPAPTKTTGAEKAPILVDATWTPKPKAPGYVKWLYWFVKPNRVTLGQCVQITWETENAVSLQLFRDDVLILDEAPPAQTLEDCPTQVGYTVYRMIGVNSAGESNWIQLQVRVTAP